MGEGKYLLEMLKYGRCLSRAWKFKLQNYVITSLSRIFDIIAENFSLLKKQCSEILSVLFTNAYLAFGLITLSQKQLINL